MANTLGNMSTALSSLARIEERQMAIREDMETYLKDHKEHEGRISDLELNYARDIPPLKEARNWLTGGVVCLIGVLFVAMMFGRITIQSQAQAAAVPGSTYAR